MHLSHLAAGAVIVSFASSVAAAPTFDRVVTFGDSLSDVGNVHDLTLGVFPPPPYFDGRLSNGPVWVEQFAPLVGAPVPTNSLADGPHATDYAYGDARARGDHLIDLGALGSLTIPGLESQVDAFLADGGPQEGDLVTLFIGNNDLGVDVDPANPAAMINAVTAAVQQQSQRLLSAGADDFVLVSIPALGVTPRANDDPIVAAGANALASAQNAAFEDVLSGLSIANPDATVYPLVDVYSLFLAVAADPEAFGLSNATDPVLNLDDSTLNGDPDEYLFWDDIHPTTAGHGLIANAVYAVVPEPTGTLPLLMAGLFVARRRRLRAL